MSTDAYARNSDPETSHEAAQCVDVTRLEEIVVATIREFAYGGCTTDQIEAVSGLRSGSVTPRIKPLMRKGLVMDTGKTRKGRSKRQQRVVVASEFFVKECGEKR